jgi:hypothetical protein
MSVRAFPNLPMQTGGVPRESPGFRDDDDSIAAFCADREWLVLQ